MSTRPDISILEESLFKVSAMMGAAESHGALCGMLCARGAIEPSDWMDHVLGEQEAGNVLLHDVVHQLTEIHQQTMEKINDIEGGFYLLLQDDDEDLIERTEALASWCQGFVYGLAAGGVSEETDLPGDCKEILLDFIEISRAGHHVGEVDDSVVATEEDELAFEEVMEYVRTGVQLINEELQPLQSPPTLH